MVEHEARDMTNRFGADGVMFVVEGAGTDNDQVSAPTGGEIHDFTFGASGAVCGFYRGLVQEAFPFQENVLRGVCLDLTNLVAARRGEIIWAQKTRAL